MKLVIAEKPSVAMSRGTSFGTGTAGGLQRTVRQMAV